MDIARPTGAWFPVTAICRAIRKPPVREIALTHGRNFNQGGTEMLKALAITAIVILATGAAALPFAPKPKPEPAILVKPTTTAALDVRKAISDGKLAVKLAMREPSSAVFGSAWFARTAVCGTVSGRNGYGGMTGQRPFVVVNGLVAIGNNELWLRHCLKN